MNILIKDNEYKQWLDDLKQRIRQNQIKAAIKINTELLHLYWDLGHDIVARQMETTWGSGFFEQLSKDLMLEFPDMKGFSIANLRFIKRFYLFYSQDISFRYQVGSEIKTIVLQQAVGKLRINDNEQNKIHQQLVSELENHSIFQIPWRHHVEIFTKCKSVKEALFYVQKTIKNGWSRAVLMNFMEADLYAAQGNALNNFEKSLPEPQSDLAREIIKDPYNFDFITLTEPYKEKELECAYNQHYKIFA
jgi:predicted nuclease of restriction endonuclease-like (RecB) superfamily